MTTWALVVVLGVLAGFAQATHMSMKTCPNGGTMVAAVMDAAPNVLQVWTTMGTPAVFLASLSVNLTSAPVLDGLNCSNPSSNLARILGAENFTYTYATMIPSIIEFDDTDRSGQYALGTPFTPYALNTNTTMWNITLASDGSGMVNFTTTDGVVSILVYPHEDSGRDAFNPFLPFDPRSSSVAVAVSNYNYTYANGKLGATLFFVSDDNDLTLTLEESIDDEYTPSIFKRDEVKAGGEAYTFWKPVAFGSSDRTVDNDTFAFPIDLSSPVPPSALPPSPLLPFFHPQTIKCRSTVVSFGEPKDDIYQYSYITWSFIAGLGAPQEESLSPSLLITIIITNSVPALAFVFGGLFLAYKKLRGGSKSGYHSIQ